MNRELDKQIAELKGIYPNTHQLSDIEGGRLPRDTCYKCHKYIYPHQYFSKECETPLAYSSNMRYAWTLFEEMQPGYYIVRDYKNDWFICNEGDDDESGWPVDFVNAKTAPEAICLAWIKWKESNGTESKEL